MRRGALMRSYRALFRQQMIAGVQFRAAFWSRLLTNIFWGYVRSVILYAFYVHGAGGAAPEGAALSLPQAVGMVWLSQAAGNLLPGWGMDFAVWNGISRGDVAYELARPLDIYAHWYARALAMRVAPFALAIVPVAGVALLVPGGLGLMPPVSPAGLLACLCALTGGLLVSCATICLSYALLMDVRFGPAPANIVLTVSQILSGLYLPLSLWPDWMQGFLTWQPFAGMMDLPLRFYVGAADPALLPQTMAAQLVWAALLIPLGRAWINRNLRKLALQGG